MTLAEAPARKHEGARAPAARPRKRPVLPIVNAVAAAVVSAAVLYAAFMPAGPLPALGVAFNPVTGAWTMAADAQVTNQTLRLAGLDQPVVVGFEANGVTHITAQTDHDLFLATGYVQARFRLFEMDLLRRQGEGRLSEVVGKAALDSDKFELQLGLQRTAQREWAEASVRVHDVLVAYSQGVNDRITEAENQHQLDVLFTMLGYQPKPWTPVDTLVVKGDMTQTLNFTDTPLVMALLNKSLGTDLTSQWFPTLPPNVQSPYDPGPYPPATTPTQIAPVSALSDAANTAIADAYRMLSALPAGLVATGGASNNWAVAASRSASGGALLAGDPHLHLTLPAIWFQLTQDSPSYHTAGVAIPGTPGVLIGHNQHIAWSLTDAQNQQTFFYLEQQDKSHPGQYFWKGSWQRYQMVSYDIPVLGGATQHIDVKLSVHGPVITERGQTMSVWWAGNIPSQDLDVLLGINQASSWNEFRDALRGWYSPTHNFVYADDQGNIGLISAGYFPIVAKGQPWLPMPGTGEYDVVGTIPFDQIPQRYDPPDGVIWSANQRQVTAGYPYYIGTTSNFFDTGYRANEIHRVLSQPGKLSASDMQALQTDTRDFLAAEIVPVLLKSLDGTHMTASQSEAVSLLQSWDFRMDTGSAAASLWWTFWQTYMDDTFNPWWTSRHVPVGRTDTLPGSASTELDVALATDLEAWTLNNPENPAFSGPGTSARTAVDVQRLAFGQAVQKLAKQLGGAPESWTWGRLHTRVLENFAQIKDLNYGPRAERGVANTPLAAHGFPSVDGPSWRMVVDWGAHIFQAVFPGGQSENPASDWYSNRVETWFDGRLDPMLTADEAAATAGAKSWNLRP
ncbi:MAG TPA: penicillin acylase family protein [Candidatus Udaeobacter sp.]|nr:penicillin acylase family protein [Candidatus Udaeobacter sp.]